MSKIEGDEPIKIILLGNSGVGKTSIINRYICDTFKENRDITFSSTSLNKEITYKNKKYFVSVWDTAGQEKYYSVNKIFIKNAKIIILVYSVTVKESFEGLKYWHDFIMNNLSDQVILGLAGNKVDLLEEDGYTLEVPTDEAEKCAEEWNATFSLLSAKVDKKGIDDFFQALVTKILDTSNLSGFERNSIRIGNDSNQKKQKHNKRSCC